MIIFLYLPNVHDAFPMHRLHECLFLVVSIPCFGWKAGINSRFRNLKDTQKLFRNNIKIKDSGGKQIQTISHRNVDMVIPHSFDARDRWVNCSTIKHIHDECCCRADWAFAAVDSISDRICIYSNGRVSVQLSARDVISCGFSAGCSHGNEIEVLMYWIAFAAVDSISDRICIYSNGRVSVQLSARDVISCGFSAGCSHGNEIEVLMYWIVNGIVTGGSYEDQSGCQPYPFSKYPECKDVNYEFPLCTSECQDGYNKTYEDDKFYGKNIKQAFATVDSISDRICIYSNGRVSVQLSARDVISCGFSAGCSHGNEIEVLMYWIVNGIVTGGSYEDQSGCQPYPFSKYPECKDVNYEFPLCTSECQDGYNKTYEDDKFYGENIYNVYDNQEDIQKEILMNGPVIASIFVKTDFLIYKSGVYLPTPRSSNLGWINLRIIGWGYEGTTPYWLCANSWSKEWGDNGYVKVQRGVQAGYIESYVRAPIPKI
ncbi:cathepsin B [Schistosoma bovis]|uniref:Cathepsin B-like cysteine proteinase n=1 Tax=Schistosoma bovis TaxID=6184 RepID=A0A430QCK5_SCHBO|nr:cathepsin B [Schistosoma bovis]